MSEQNRDIMDSNGINPRALDREPDAVTADKLASVTECASATSTQTARKVQAGADEKLLNDRYELTRRVNIGCGDQVVRALDRNKLKFEDNNPFTTLIFIPGHWTGNQALLAPVLTTLQQWQVLGHPNIVQTQDFVQGDFHSFLTTEHLQGCSLDRWYADNLNTPLTVPERLRIINMIGSALSYAHARDLVHGKLSPAAIWLFPSTPAKLFDPGVCTFLDANSVETGTGKRRYPASTYLSAEATATPQQTDRRMDVFAFAAISYELLTGQHPFDGLNTFEARTRNVNIRHLAPLTHRQWSAFKRALEFRASTRTASVQEFLEDLNGPESLRWLPMAAAAGIGALMLAGGSYFFSEKAKQNNIENVSASAQVSTAEEPATAPPRVRQAAVAEEQIIEPEAAANEAESDDPSEPPDYPENAEQNDSEQDGGNTWMSDSAEQSDSHEMVQTLIERGNAQLAAGQFTEPRGSAAIETFQEIVRRAPNNEDAKSGVHTLSAYLLAEAEKALAAKDVETAQLALYRAQTIEPTASGLVEALQQLLALQQANAVAQQEATE